MVLLTALILLLGSLCVAQPAARGDEPADLATRSGEDWGAFLGPTGNGRSGLDAMTIPWPAAGPRVVWHTGAGEGYCGPAVALGRAVVFDRVGRECRLRCLHAETGRPLWEHRYPTAYADTFGYDGGPRAAPVIAHGRVLSFGPEGRLECRRLDDGESLWHVDTSAEYHVVQNFFGVGAAPLVLETAGRRIVVVQVGGSRPGSAPPSPERLELVKGLDSGLVAFDLETGRESWRSSDQLASYSTPVAAAFGGEPRILAWMRDDFLVVDPADGGVKGRFRWRADDVFSAVAASPVVSGDEVLLSEAYAPGSVVLDLAAVAGPRPAGPPPARGRRRPGRRRVPSACCGMIAVGAEPTGRSRPTGPRPCCTAAVSMARAAATPATPCSPAWTGKQVRSGGAQGGMDGRAWSWPADNSWCLANMATWPSCGRPPTATKRSRECGSWARSPRAARPTCSRPPAGPRR
jgi:outer membrane protein assembly factor BamB